MLLSATLNEKVNHLANISLDNPVMIGLDDTKIKPSNKQVTLLNNAIETLQNSGKASSNAEYKLPAQLNQRYVKGKKRRQKFHVLLFFDYSVFFLYFSYGFYCTSVPCGSRLVVLLFVLKNLFTGEPSQKVKSSLNFILLVTFATFLNYQPFSPYF